MNLQNDNVSTVEARSQQANEKNYYVYVWDEKDTFSFFFIYCSSACRAHIFIIRWKIYDYMNAECTMFKEAAENEWYIVTLFHVTQTILSNGECFRRSGFFSSVFVHGTFWGGMQARKICCVEYEWHH